MLWLALPLMVSLMLLLKAVSFEPLGTISGHCYDSAPWGALAIEKLEFLESISFSSHRHDSAPCRLSSISDRKN
jgi:hypothetical protein